MVSKRKRQLARRKASLGGTARFKGTAPGYILRVRYPDGAMYDVQLDTRELLDAKLEAQAFLGKGWFKKSGRAAERIAAEVTILDGNRRPFLRAVPGGFRPLEGLAAPVSSGMMLGIGAAILGIGYLLTRSSSSGSSGGGSTMTLPEQQASSILGTGLFAESKTFRVGRANVGPMDGPKFKAALQAMADGPYPGWIDSVQYSDMIIRASKAKKVSPFAVATLGAHESRWGRALTPPGPGGNGDYEARAMGSKTSPPKGCKVVTTLPAGWTPRSDAKTGPWYIPIDEKGFGRGLMQLDVVGSGLGDMPGWQDPETAIGYGAQVLANKRAALMQAEPGLKGIDLLVASLEAYNYGEGNVIANIKAGKPIAAGRYDGKPYAATYILPAMQALETNFIDVQGGGQVSV